MEENVNETQQNIHEFFKRMLFERDEKIKALEAALKKQPEADNVWKEKYHMALDALEAQKTEANTKLASLQSQLNGLKDLHQKQQVSRSTDKTQNALGGAMWTMSFLALGLLAGYLLHKYTAKPQENSGIVFNKFREDNQFNYEFEISQGRFATVEKSLNELSTQPKYADIKAELDFTRKLIGASRAKFEDLGFKPTEGGVALPAPSDEPVIVDNGKKKTLAVTEVESLTIRAEASTRSEKLGTLKKGEQATVVDRTNGTDKLRLTKDGRQVEMKDYWYKVETKSGVEGWVFGHFTTRSLNTFSYLDEVGSDTAAAKPVAAKPAETKPVAPPTGN